jgi:23S rRNA pseudouridine2605 synthase
VKVDGHTVTEPSFLADPARHHVTVDGKPVRRPVRSRVYLVHKPPGLPAAQAVPGSAALTGGRPSTPPGRILSLGGLGVGSEGLLLFTTDGALAQLLARVQLPEAYRVRVRGRPTARTMDKLRRGVVRPARGQLRVERAVLTGKGRNVWLVLRVARGRDREIRSVLRSLGHTVVRLRRTAIGPAVLAQSHPGEWRELRPEEVERLVETARRVRAEASARRRRP